MSLHHMKKSNHCVTVSRKIHSLTQQTILTPTDSQTPPVENVREWSPLLSTAGFLLADFEVQYMRRDTEPRTVR